MGWVSTGPNKPVLLTATFKVCVKISPILIPEQARANRKEVNFILSCQSPPSQVAVEHCSLLTFPKGLALLVNSSYALTVLHSYLHRKIGHVSLEKKAIEKQMVECFKKIKDFLFFKVFTQLNSSPLSLNAYMISFLTQVLP